MSNHSVLPMKAKFAPAREGSWRRTSHGSSAFSNELMMTQPQDGAEARTAAARVASINSRISPMLVSEPEDARLTGATRSLFRRLTGLNIMVSSEPTTPAKSSRKPAQLVSTLLPQQAQVA